MLPEHLKIETIDHTPEGGQRVSVLPRGVKVTHLPTGLTASCSLERSQTRNRDIAIAMIEFALDEAEVHGEMLYEKLDVP